MTLCRRRHQKDNQRYVDNYSAKDGQKNINKTITILLPNPNKDYIK